jgi:hypothetical protein
LKMAFAWPTVFWQPLSSSDQRTSSTLHGRRGRAGQGTAGERLAAGQAGGQHRMHDQPCNAKTLSRQVSRQEEGPLSSTCLPAMPCEHSGP